MTEVISPQSILVDRVPRHVKDLHLRHNVTSLEEDSDGTSSESVAESLLCDTEDTEPDDLPEEGAVAERPPVPLHRSTRQNGRCQTTIFVIMRSARSVAREETYLLDQSA